MKAIVYHDYGSADVLKVEEAEEPTPKDDEVLIKVRAASVNPLDWRLMKGKPYFIRMTSRLLKMKTGRPGVDVAGEVQAVGRNVTQFKTGDAIFGSCRGAFADYAGAPESDLALKPDDMSFEQAASVNVAAMTALQALRNKGQIGPGHKVLINGAAGGVGTFAVQIAKEFGAEVTGVCSTRNLDLVRSIGADHVIDYTKDDFTKGTERYDLIFEGVGNLSFSACRRVLKRAGKFIMVGAPHSSSMIGIMGPAIKAVVLSLFVSEKAMMFLASPNQQDLAIMSEWISSGKVTPVIDRCYKLSEVPEAVRYLEQGHARGKVVISLT
ncbi:MAG TPA: NAD(P)-dependent alcohol dehydrogenase [Pyrinomonadaceae bacterium]|nr:NAD(P)-dependent alcohol dehydrogenase [Pyrinomonadaceae bacterium]